MDRRLDTDKFVDWCERQAEQSRSTTARYIGEFDGEHRCRLREEGETEDIILVKGNNVDTVRFEKKRQYHMNRRDVELHRKTLLVKDRKTGKTMTRAGAGTKKRRGPFPF